MDTLKAIPEHVEAEFGDSIVARDEAVAVLGRTSGLGPPDLCWLQKGPKSKGWLGGSSTTESQGYYHFVLGRDVSSSAAVCAYFALLNSKVEPLTMLQGLWLTSEFAIQRGFYCCYDPLSRMDLRCELCVPGGVVVGCVDAAGTVHEITPQLWTQVQVCSFVRAMLYDAEMRLNGGSVIAYEPVPTAAAERSLLSGVLQLYSNGTLPGALQDIYAQQGCGVLPEHMDAVLAALWQHFRRHQRWAAAAAFFRQLAQVYSPATLLLAAAQRAQGLAGIAGATGNLLAELLLMAGHTGAEELPPATLVGLAHECLEAGRVEEAQKMARHALQAMPRCRPAWLLLAQCFIAQRQYAAALVALNVVPTPPLPAAEVELLHVVPPPPPAKTTQPQCQLYDGELEGVRAQALEEASLDGSRLLAYLPGSILVNREPLGTGYIPDSSPNRITRSVLAAVYTLLQDIVSQTSWDEFLEIRSRVFLMQHEAATPRAASVQLKHETEQQHEATTAAALQRKVEQITIQQSIDSTNGQDTEHAVNGHSLQMIEQQTKPSVPAAAGSPLAAASAGPHAAPPSRDRGSSSGGGGQRGSPKSYYASRLQEELHKPGASAGGRSSSSSTASMPGSPASQQQLDLQHGHQPEAAADHQQEDPQHLSGSRTSAADAASAAAVVAAPARPSTGTAKPPRSSVPGDVERSMAGRVLLLGRTHSRRISSGSSQPSNTNVFSAGRTGDCGVPRTLAPNELEDLSKMATASKVAPIRTSASASITPQLYEVVFGAARSPPAAGSRRALHYQQQQLAAEEFTSNTALPRIRTKPDAPGMGPLGEAVEQHSSQQTAGASCCGSSSSSSSSTGAVVGCTFPSGSTALELARSQHDCRHSMKHHHLGSSWLFGCFGCTAASQPSSCRSQRVGTAVTPGPVAEGLDRTSSLLLRTSSVASSAGHATTSSRLQAAGASGNYGPLAPSGGSGAFGSSLARRASLSGEAVSRTLDADREGLVNGCICDDASAEMAAPDGSIVRRLCVRWLDELIVALWHDLQSYMEWKVWDHRLKEARGGTHAELVLGLVPGSSDTPRTPINDGGNITPPILTSIDWERRGALAERLGHCSDARAAYRASVKLGFNLTSYMALLRLEAQASNASDALLCAQQVLAWHTQHLRRASSSGGSTGGSHSSNFVECGVPPSAVSYFLGCLCDNCGYDGVVAAAQQAPDALKAVLHEWSRWQQVKLPEPLQLQQQHTAVL